MRWEVKTQLLTQTAAHCVGMDRATIKELYEQIYSHCVSILDVQALKPSCVFPSLFNGCYKIPFLMISLSLHPFTKWVSQQPKWDMGFVSVVNWLQSQNLSPCVTASQPQLHQNNWDQPINKGSYVWSWLFKCIHMPHMVQTFNKT